MTWVVVHDIAAPTVAITATIDTTGTLQVIWSATDPSTGSGQGSGVRDYDVEYKVDDGAWTGWFTDTQQTAGSLPGERGHVYGFRVRATDRACAEPVEA